MGEMTPQEKKEFYNKFDDLDRNIQRILFILESDSRTGEKGLVERVHNVEEDVREIKLRETIFKTKASTWGIVGGSIAAFLYWAAKLLLTKFI